MGELVFSALFLKLKVKIEYELLSSFTPKTMENTTIPMTTEEKYAKLKAQVKAMGGDISDFIAYSKKLHVICGKLKWDPTKKEVVHCDNPFDRALNGFCIDKQDYRGCNDCSKLQRALDKCKPIRKWEKKVAKRPGCTLKIPEYDMSKDLLCTDVRMRRIRTNKDKMVIICTNGEEPHEWHTTMDNFKSKSCGTCANEAKKNREYHFRDKEEQYRDLLIAMRKKGCITKSAFIDLDTLMRFECLRHSKKPFDQKPRGMMTSALKCEDCVYERDCLGRDIIVGRIRARFGPEAFNLDAIGDRAKAVDKLPITCNECDYKWEARLCDLIDATSHGCPKCYNKSRSLGIEGFLERIRIKHPEFMEKYGYDKVLYTNNSTHIQVYCNSCRENFYITPTNHVDGGSGCFRCHSSKAEKAIREKLKSSDVDFWEQVYMERKEFPGITEEEWQEYRRLRYDFYLPKYKLFIEYDGSQHFKAGGMFGEEKELAARQMRDSKKNDYCRGKFLLLRIPYTSEKMIDEIIDETLIELEKFCYALPTAIACILELVGDVHVPRGYLSILKEYLRNNEVENEEFDMLSSEWDTYYKKYVEPDFSTYYQKK